MQGFILYLTFRQNLKFITKLTFFNERSYSSELHGRNPGSAFDVIMNEYHIITLSNRKIIFQYCSTLHKKLNLKEKAMLKKIDHIEANFDTCKITQNSN